MLTFHSLCTKERIRRCQRREYIRVLNILTYAAKAQESKPPTGLTVVVPINSALDITAFRG